MERVKKAVRYFYDIKTLAAQYELFGRKFDDEERMELYVKLNELNYISETLKIVKSERKYKKETIFDENYECGTEDVCGLDELRLKLIINGKEYEELKIERELLEKIRWKR